MKQTKRPVFTLILGALSLFMIGAFPGVAFADGTEVLGPPSISIAEGTGFVAAGVGLRDVQPGNIDITVPAGASIEQVLLYWEGQMTTNVPGDNSILVDGNPVTGTLIGGQTFFFSDAYSSCFRADITSLGVVNNGANSIPISGLDFDRVNNGAGIVVIYDEGGDKAEIGIVDGIDLAYHAFPSPRDVTVAQTFTFAASPNARLANVILFASSVSDGGHRPSSIEVTVGGTVHVFSDKFNNSDGPEWDTVNDLQVAVPAGVTSVTVQAFSRDDLGSGDDPASFAWLCGGLNIMPYIPQTPKDCNLNEPGSLLVYPLIDNINYSTIVDMCNKANQDVWLHGFMIVHPPGNPTDFEKTDFVIHLTQQEPFWWDTSQPYFRVDAHGFTTAIPGFDNRKGFMFVWAVDSDKTRAEIPWNYLKGDAMVYGGGRAFQYNAIPHKGKDVVGDRILNLDCNEYSMGRTQHVIEGFAENALPGLEGTWVVCCLEIDFIQSIQPAFDINLSVWNQDEVFQSRHVDFYQFQQYKFGDDLGLYITQVFTPKFQFVTSTTKPIWSIAYQTLGTQAWGTNVWCVKDSGVPIQIVLPPIPQG